MSGMTVLRHQLLGIDGKPVAGHTASVMVYNPEQQSKGGYRRVKVVHAVSDDDGYLEWTLPRPKSGVTDPVYVVSGIESQLVLVTVPTSVSTATVGETKTGTLPLPPGVENGTDLVTEAELAKRLAGLTPSLPARLSEEELRAAFGRPFKSPKPRPFAPPTAITAPATIGVNGVDPTTPGRIFGSNRSFGPLAQSDDGGTTWVNRDAPAGTTTNSVQKTVVFKGKVYVLITDTASGQVGIYRATNSPAVGNWGDWSTALVQTPVGIEGKSTIFNAGSQYLFFGEYEADGVDLVALGGPQLRRSVDGVTWETVWGRDAATKHIHAIYEDPYNPGHIYMTVGDNGTPHSVLRSTNHGAPGSWVPIISAAGNEWQSVQISFSPEWVWLASDRRGFAVAVFDRDDLDPFVVASNLPRMMAVPGAAVTTDRFYELGYYGAVDPATGVFYLNQSDTSTSGNTFGNFYLPQLGGRLELLDFGKSGSYSGNGEVFIANGRVYIGNVNFPTIQPFPS